MKIHPILHLNGKGDLTLKNGQVIKPTSSRLHAANLKGAGWFSKKWKSLKERFKKVDKKKLLDNVVRTHGTIKGLMGGRQAGSKQVNSVHQLSSDRLTHAKFAQAAYSQPKRVGSYTLIPESSNKDVSFYRGPDNKVVATVAGTRPGVRDIKQDFQLAQNKKGSVTRVNTVSKSIERFMKKHPDTHVTMAGHSLGGYVGHHAHDKLTKQGLGHRLGNMYSYNMGVSPLGLSKSSNQEAQKLQTILKGKKHMPTVISNDAVSAGIQGFSGTKNLVTVAPIHSGPQGLARNHSISNFIVSPNKLKKKPNPLVK